MADDEFDEINDRIEELLASAREVTNTLDKISRRNSLNSLLFCVTAVTLVALLAAVILLA